MTGELQPLSLQDRGEMGALDLSTLKGLNQFLDGVIENAARGRDMDRLQYFQDLLILDAKGVLKGESNLQRAVIQSGQDPLIWEGVYIGCEESVNVLQNPDASPQQKQIARQNLQAYFRITEITHMDAPPNYPDPAVQARVYPGWEAVWFDLNNWRPLIQEEITPPEQDLTPPEEADLPKLFEELAKVWFDLSSGQLVQSMEIETRINQTLHLKSIHPSPFPLLPREGKLYDLIRNPSQLQLLERLFAQTPPELQEAFTRLKNSYLALDESQIYDSAYYAAADQFTRPVYNQIGLDFDQVKKEANEKFDALDLANEEFTTLMKKVVNDESVPADELTRAYITRNRTRNEYNQLDLDITAKLHQFFSPFADKAGIEIVLNRNPWEDVLIEKAST